MACTQDHVAVFYQVRTTANNKVFGPVKTFEAAQELLNTVVANGAAEAVIERTASGPKLVTGDQNGSDA